MLKGNKTLFIVALIAIVNALGYGIIIPILYTYSQRFGLTVFQNGLLFTTFSLCQFVSAPFIGRLSDKYGRRPTLTVSIAGTALSFFTMAFAPSIFYLFLARIIDGVTAGNFPVLSAVISDTLEPKDRAKGFGVVGAAFGFGFVFGPAISALTFGINPALPFLISGIITVIATIMTWMLLPETNKHMGQVEHKHMFDFSGLYHALFDHNVNLLLIIGLVYSLVFSAYITIFQPYANNVLHYTGTQLSLFFTGIGVIGIITQVALIGRFTKWFGPRLLYSLSLFSSILVFLGMYASGRGVIFVLFGLLFALVNSFISPLTQTLLSNETDDKSQGSMQGISASYASIGQIIGPIIGGFMASLSLSVPFLGIAGLALLCFLISLGIHKPKVRVHAFEK